MQTQSQVQHCTALLLHGEAGPGIHSWRHSSFRQCPGGWRGCCWGWPPLHLFAFPARLWEVVTEGKSAALRQTNSLAAAPFTIPNLIQILFPCGSDAVEPIPFVLQGFIALLEGTGSSRKQTVHGICTEVTDVLKAGPFASKNKELLSHDWDQAICQH